MCRDLGGRRGGRRRSFGPSSPSSCRTPRSWAQPSEPAGIVVHRIESLADGFVVEREADDAFRVRGRRIERIAAQTDFEVEESAERFQRDLARLGIDAELRRAGIEPGDTVRIGSVELEWDREAWEVR